MLTSISPKSICGSKKESKKKCDCKKCTCKKETIEEAETEATGAELRAKVEKAVKQVFKTQLSEENDIELYDLRTSAEPFYFSKITIKKRDTEKSDK